MTNNTRNREEMIAGCHRIYYRKVSTSLVRVITYDSSPVLEYQRGKMVLTLKNKEGENRINK